MRLIIKPLKVNVFDIFTLLIMLMSVQKKMEKIKIVLRKRALFQTVLNDTIIGIISLYMFYI